MKRSLACVGALNTTSESSTISAGPASKCTKCQKVVTPTSEFHKHILECGGDTTWMSTMFASSSMKKHKYVCHESELLNYRTIRIVTLNMCHLEDGNLTEVEEERTLVVCEVSNVTFLLPR